MAPQSNPIPPAMSDLLPKIQLNPDLPALDARDPSPTPSPTSVRPVVVERADSIVTMTVVASSSASASAATDSSKSSFPVAVAIPALVGGMAVAIIGAGLWWWIAKKRRREKMRRWEAHQRRQRKRANSATSRPVITSQRSTSGGASGAKSPIDEKGFITPLPILPKDTYGKSERVYGYPQQHQQQHQPDPYTQVQGGIQDANGAAPSYSYPVQPTIEHVEDPNIHSATGSTQPPVLENESGNSSATPARPSRSTARVAAADNAAAREAADPISRYRPNKPSPLALKAEQEKAANSASNLGYGRPADDRLETLAPEGYQHNQAPSDGYAPTARATSGEWGVALGSPNNDGTFGHDQSYAQAQGYSFTAGAQQAAFPQDPYLSAAGAGGYNPRAPSGQYTSDPYASYHNASADVDYHAAANEVGVGKESGASKWV